MVVTEEAATICYWKVVNIRDVKDSGCQKALLRAEVTICILQVTKYQENLMQLKTRKYQQVVI